MVDSFGCHLGELGPCGKRVATMTDQKLVYNRQEGIASARVTVRVGSAAGGGDTEKASSVETGASPAWRAVTCKMTSDPAGGGTVLGKNGSSQQLLFIKITTKA